MTDASIPTQADPHLRRWMLFVDGENFTIRAQQLAKDKAVSLAEGKHHIPNVFVWLPTVEARYNAFGTAPIALQPTAIRAYYYATAQGDDQRLATVRESLWLLGFEGKVFRRDASTKRSKAVDIALAVDFLANAFLDNYDAAVLVAGDGDYVPMVNEVKRIGKVVYVAFFRDYGLNPALRLAADQYFEFGDAFAKVWR